MNSFKIDIAVTVGVTDELSRILSAILKPAAPAILKACEVTGCEQHVPVTEAPVKLLAEDKQPTPVAPAEEPQAEAEQQPTPEAPADPQPEAAKVYTEVDVRDAMDRTRRRIEGENYKEQTDSEGYRKWHRKLTGYFKNTAAILGADKPSTLPDSDSRKRFCEMCDAVEIINDELSEQLPF